MHMYTPGEFGKKIHVAVKTLQRWDRQGVLKAHRTASNRRYYTQEDLRKILPEEERSRRRTIAYCRVSSVAQKPDLENQRKQFLKLVDAIIAGEVAVLLIAHKDRLARFGFSLLEHLCATHDCRLLVMNSETVSPEQE